jgi:predicted AAA+ superfamily ATPase
MADLVGCESQKKALLENLEIMLAGFRANNMLLYGDSGTGKSSSVKALLNSCADKRLKLISVAKDRLHLLPGVFDQIKDRGMKFIIFIDDLSFEDNEYEFKAFKSIIEGRIAPRPENAIFIVTTNRKNIVKESWGDRQDLDDVRRRDNMEEKRSLSDRFGITVIYSSPDKKEYLAIVRSLAEKAGLNMPESELFSEAMKWEIRHGGRSGRAARQFVDHMTGVKAVTEKEAHQEKAIR